MKRRTMILLAVSLLLVSGCASNRARNVNVYTPAMTEAHTQLVSNSPYVIATASGDAKLALPGTPAKIKDFVVGITPGNTDPCYPYSPAHNIYAYKITDPHTPGPKRKAVIITGNHNTETSGSWAFQGMVDFILSNEPEAVRLRQMCDFWVYPLVNPDGRFTAKGRGNPEICRLHKQGLFPEGTRYNDHNRLWHLAHPKPCGASTIDVLTAAMLRDSDAGSTGGIDYYFDFHGSGSTFFYTVPELMDCPYIQAFAALDVGVGPRARTAEQATLGSSRIWARLPVPWGLGAKWSFTPENDRKHSVSYFLRLGRSYGIALHNTIVAESAESSVLKTGTDR